MAGNFTITCHSFWKLRDYFEISRRENIWVDDLNYIDGIVPYGTIHYGLITISTHIWFLKEHYTKFKTVSKTQAN